MSSENDEAGVSFVPPGEVDDWLAREAGRRGETREDVCRRLVTAAHAVATDGDVATDVAADVDAVQARLDAQREEFADLLEDVRSRVVQVKRETDAKAPVDHDHAEYAAADDLAALRSDLESLEATVDDGFDNFETVLEELLAETDDLESRADLLATAVLDLRERRTAAAQRERRRTEADRIKRAANRLGVRTAVCDACGEPVDLALLTASECPHCASEVTDVAEKDSLFGSPALVTGEPPALEGRVGDAAGPATEEVFAAVEADAEPDRDDSSSEPFLEIDAEGPIR